MGEREPEQNINFHGKQFTGSTVGIVGMGRIGYTVAQRAKAFNCKVLYHNRSERKDVEDLGAEYYSSLNDMLPKCDFVCVVVALTTQTSKMFTYDHFCMMKKSAIFCNVSRQFANLSELDIYNQISSNSLSQNYDQLSIIKLENRQTWTKRRHSGSRGLSPGAE